MQGILSRVQGIFPALPEAPELGSRGSPRSPLDFGKPGADRRLPGMAPLKLGLRSTTLFAPPFARLRRPAGGVAAAFRPHAGSKPSKTWISLIRNRMSVFRKESKDDASSQNPTLGAPPGIASKGRIPVIRGLSANAKIAQIADIPQWCGGRAVRRRCDP